MRIRTIAAAIVQLSLVHLELKAQQIITIDAGTKPATVTGSNSQTLDFGKQLDFVVNGLKAGDQVQATVVCDAARGAIAAQAAAATSATLSVPAGGQLPAVGPIPAAKLVAPCTFKILRGNDELASISVLGTSVTVGSESVEAYARRVLKSVIAQPNDAASNTIHIVVASSGRMLSPTPVNADQDDRFMITIVGLRSELDRYDVRVDEGIYTPSDFVLRPATAIQLEKLAQGSKQAAGDGYGQITIEKGPFTSATFKFTITYDDSSKDKVVDLKSYSIPINPLYHAGLGIGVEKTWLSAPSYVVAPLNATQSTIRATNDGDRAIGVLSAILYWQVLDPDFWTGGVITRGYDPLKETKPWKRLFPVIGVGLDKKITNDVFYGGLYEFTRGASISAGWHYGKTTVLADPSFVLGQTPFTGATADIKTSTVSRTNRFIGMVVDTRLLTGLFGITK